MRFMESASLSSRVHRFDLVTGVPSGAPPPPRPPPPPPRATAATGAERGAAAGHRLRLEAPRELSICVWRPEPCCRTPPPLGWRRPRAAGSGTARTAARLCRRGEPPRRAPPPARAAAHAAGRWLRRRPCRHRRRRRPPATARVTDARRADGVLPTELLTWPGCLFDFHCVAAAAATAPAAAATGSMRLPPTLMLVLRLMLMLLLPPPPQSPP